MPEVLVKARVGKARMRLLLNSGARDLELVLPLKTAIRAGVKMSKRARVVFGGRELQAKAGYVDVTVEGPKPGESRKSKLEVVVLPDKLLDCPLLGVVGQEKLRIVPDTVSGEAIFR